MKVSVRYFASIREAIGTGHEAVDTAATTLHGLWGQAARQGGRPGGCTRVRGRGGLTF